MGRRSGTIEVSALDRIKNEWWWRRSLLREWWVDTLPRTIAQRLPQRVVYHAVIRAWVFSLSGKHGHQHPSEVTTSETVRRWDEQDH